MNKVLCVTALCLGVLVLGAPSTVFAMDPSLAKIPFSFIVGDNVLPAGEYRVSDVIGMDSVVKIVSTDGQAEAMAIVGAISPNTSVTEAPGVFKFKKIGNEYYLSSVTVSGEGTIEFVLPRHVITAESIGSSSQDEHHRQ